MSSWLHFGISVLGTLFSVGMAGSAIGLILPAIEEIETLADRGGSH